MNEEQLREAIARGHEIQSVEFKSSGPRTDPLLFARVLRAAFGMSNRRDGGYVVVGVKETATGYQPVGLPDTQLDTWQYDQIATGFATYADPSIRFEREIVMLDGLKILVIQVHGFVDVPILCKKPLTVNGKVMLKEGGCYVRSVRKPETAEVSTYEDMRDLLELAIEKRLYAYISTADRSGVALAPKGNREQGQTQPDPTDQDRFQREIAGL